MLRNCMAASRLQQHVPVVISVDAVRAYKPHPAVCRLAAETLRAPSTGSASRPPTRSTLSAHSTGMRTAWANRAAQPLDTLGPEPDITGTFLAELPALHDGPDWETT
jgi:FMN phosphatase YigB (HAD superfamily)